MQYLAWRVLYKRNRISFLFVGHTKFAPDWCFGQLKQMFRKTLVGCLEDLTCVVDQSARTNHAQLVSMEDGTVLVDQYDWVGYFQSYFRRGAFDGIKSLHHLVFSSAAPGTAVVRNSCNAEGKTLTLLKWTIRAGSPAPVSYHMYCHHLGYHWRGGGTSTRRSWTLSQILTSMLCVLLLFHCQPRLPQIPVGASHCQPQPPTSKC